MLRHTETEKGKCRRKNSLRVFAGSCGRIVIGPIESPQLLQNTDDIIFVTASAFVADTLQHQSVLVDKAAKDRSLSQRIDEGNGGPKVAGTNTIKCTDFIE